MTYANHAAIKFLLLESFSNHQTYLCSKSKKSTLGDHLLTNVGDTEIEDMANGDQEEIGVPEGPHSPLYLVSHPSSVHINP
ncbi:hypothetical protein FRC11_015000 [Ceratobasidium sp. 423]|nr:hypothetical protein FRC11_015000 [Ceratobasidium sp. 423]